MHMKPQLAFCFSPDWQKFTGLIAHSMGDAMDNGQCLALLMEVESEPCLGRRMRQYIMQSPMNLGNPSILLFWIWSKDNLGRI